MAYQWNWISVTSASTHYRLFFSIVPEKALSVLHGKKVVAYLELSSDS